MLKHVVYAAAFCDHEIRIEVGEPDGYGRRTVLAVEVLTCEEWLEGEWTGDRLEVILPEDIHMGVYLCVEQAVVEMLADEVAA